MNVRRRLQAALSRRGEHLRTGLYKAPASARRACPIQSSAQGDDVCGESTPPTESAAPRSAGTATAGRLRAGRGSTARRSACRAGGAMMSPVALSLLTTSLHGEDRAKALAIYVHRR